MPARTEGLLNGAQTNGAHINDATKQRFDTIEDTIQAFSMFSYALSVAFLPHQVMSIFYPKHISRSRA